jgi:hypothetical protein
MKASKLSVATVAVAASVAVTGTTAAVISAAPLSTAPAKTIFVAAPVSPAPAGFHWGYVNGQLALVADTGLHW